MATGRFKCAAQVCDWVEKTFGRRFTPAGMRKLLVRLGCSFHKASAFLFKADHGKQEEFVADYQQDKEKVQSDPDIQKTLAAADVDHVFNSHRLITNVDRIFERVFKQ